MQHANLNSSCLKTICPDGTPAEPAGIGSCSHGPCNLFCCNCDGGCRLNNIKVNASASVRVMIFCYLLHVVYFHSQRQKYSFSFHHFKVKWVFCSTSLPLASTRCARSTLLSLCCPLPTLNSATSTILGGMPGIEPGAAGCEVRTLSIVLTPSPRAIFGFGVGCHRFGTFWGLRFVEQRKRTRNGDFHFGSTTFAPNCIFPSGAKEILESLSELLWSVKQLSSP